MRCKATSTDRGKRRYPWAPPSLLDQGSQSRAPRIAADAVRDELDVRSLRFYLFSLVLTDIPLYILSSVN